jgi:hypothetical protein
MIVFSNFNWISERNLIKRWLTSIFLRLPLLLLCLIVNLIFRSDGISHRARRHLVCMISLLFGFFRSFVSWTSCLGLILAWCIFLTIDILVNKRFFFLVRSTLFWLSLTRAFPSLLFFRLFCSRLFRNDLLSAYLIELLCPFSNTRLH